MLILESKVTFRLVEVVESSPREHQGQRGSQPGVKHLWLSCTTDKLTVGVACLLTQNCGSQRVSAI